MHLMPMNQCHRNSTIQVISLLSTDAEIYALTESMKYVLFFRGVLGALHQPQLLWTVICNDNQSAMTLATAFGRNVQNVKSICLESMGVWNIQMKPCSNILDAHVWFSPDIGTNNLPVKDFTKKRGHLLGFPSDTIRVKKSVIKESWYSWYYYCAIYVYIFILHAEWWFV
jgi:hypothetical protein